MRFTLAVGLTLLCAHAVVAEEVKPGALTYLDAQYGFRDLKFEQDLASCKDMVLLEDDGDLKYYSRTSDALAQGGIKLKAIEYGFYKGQLACVTMNVADDADPAPLLKSLVEEYGPAKPSPAKVGKFYWFGEKVLVDFWTGGIGRGTVGWWSKPMQERQKADRAAKSK